jgi:hypothetical protein
MNYCVDYWGSHPDEDNDDCWTGTEHATLEEARAAFEGPIPSYADGDTAVITLGHRDETGPKVVITIIDERHVKRTKRRDNGDAEWQREQAMQAGMGLGVAGYNDAMGCDIDTPEDLAADAWQDAQEERAFYGDE